MRLNFKRQGYSIWATGDVGGRLWQSPLGRAVTVKLEMVPAASAAGIFSLHGKMAKQSRGLQHIKSHPVDVSVPYKTIGRRRKQADGITL